MKIMITILRKNGSCRTWTNASAEEHVSMGLAVHAESIKRCTESWGTETDEVLKVIRKALESEE